MQITPNKFILYGELCPHFAGVYRQEEVGEHVYLNAMVHAGFDPKHLMSFSTYKGGGIVQYELSSALEYSHNQAK